MVCLEDLGSDVSSCNVCVLAPVVNTTLCKRSLKTCWEHCTHCIWHMYLAKSWIQWYKQHLTGTFRHGCTVKWKKLERVHKCITASLFELESDRLLQDGMFKQQEEQLQEKNCKLQSLLWCKVKVSSKSAISHAKMFTWIEFEQAIILASIIVGIARSNHGCYCWEGPRGLYLKFQNRSSKMSWDSLGYGENLVQVLL